MSDARVDRIWACTRRDLEWSHRCVQVGHVLVELAKLVGDVIINDHTLVVLGVDAEPDLDHLLHDIHHPCLAYYEADLGKSLTAVAGLGRPPKRLRLL